MATSADAASSPGLVRFSSPWRDQRRPQIVPSTGAPSASNLTSGPMASTARSPSSRSPHAARARTVASAAASSVMSSRAGRVSCATSIADPFSATGKRPTSAKGTVVSSAQKTRELGRMFSVLHPDAGWGSGWDSGSGSVADEDVDVDEDWHARRHASRRRSAPPAPWLQRAERLRPRP